MNYNDDAVDDSVEADGDVDGDFDDGDSIDDKRFIVLRDPVLCLLLYWNAWHELVPGRSTLDACFPCDGA